MKRATGGLIAAAVAVLVAGTASAQSTGTYQYQQQQVPSYGQQQTYQAPQGGSAYGLPSYGTQQGGATYGLPSYGAQQGGAAYGLPSYGTQQGGSVTYGAQTGGTTTYGAPSGTTTYDSGSTVYTSPSTSAGTTTYGTQQGTTTYQQVPQAAGTVFQQPDYSQGFPVPQPYNPGQPIFPGFPTQPQPQVVYPGPGTAPSNPNPAPGRRAIEDTDAWTFNVARYYPAIKACLRNTSVDNPVVANIQERRNATVMLIGQGGTSEYSVCRTGLNGTRVRPGKEERGLPPAFYAPIGSAFTITPDRPFQPVVDTGQRLLGWVVRTQPVRLDVYGGGRTFDGQFIRPVTVNPDAQ